MKKLANLLAAIGISLVAYLVIVKFTGRLNIDWGLGIGRLLEINPRSGLILALFLLLMAIFIKLSIREKGAPVSHALPTRRILFWLSSVIISGLFLALFSFYLIKTVDHKVIEKFNHIYFENAQDHRIKWLGIPSLQTLLIIGLCRK